MRFNIGSMFVIEVNNPYTLVVPYKTDDYLYVNFKRSVYCYHAAVGQALHYAQFDQQ